MPTRRVLLLPLAALLLAGCFTGQRPSFQDEKFGPGTTTGDAAIDTVLATFDQAADVPPTFTATYDIVVRFQNLHKKATVVIDGNQRSLTMESIPSTDAATTIGTGTSTDAPTDAAPTTAAAPPADAPASIVRFLQTPSITETCKATTCTPGIDATAISDTQLTVEFWASDMAKRLRSDATSKIGPTAQSTQTLAGQDASCVGVVQSNNTATYCVLSDGVLARLIDADLYITLSSFEPTADPAAFVAPD
ncbi:MAG: hypothetical protein JWM12_2405 [Ilumatobacteraceae bacterium]|nr:hypothetical protein [Ilumatobacteraceae bacterium]